MAQSSQTALHAHELWRAFSGSRDSRARSGLIELYMPLARTIAIHVYGLRPDQSVSFEDYLQYARVGLIEAIDRFDVGRGVPFESYSAHRIRGAILNGIGQESESAAQGHFWRTRMQDRMQSAVGMTGANPQRASLRNLIDITISIALGLVLDEAQIEPIDETPGSDPYAAAEQDQFSRRVRALVEDLPAREREVIKGHYFNHQEFQEIAQRYAVTRGRVSQLHAKALQRLHTMLDERPRLNRKL